MTQTMVSEKQKITAEKRNENIIQKAVSMGYVSAPGNDVNDAINFLTENAPVFRHEKKKVAEFGVERKQIFWWSDGYGYSTSVCGQFMPRDKISNGRAGEKFHLAKVVDSFGNVVEIYHEVPALYDVRVHYWNGSMSNRGVCCEKEDAEILIARIESDFIVSYAELRCIND